VAVDKTGLAGDLVANRRIHGGEDQALYAYAREDAAWWAAELGRELPPGRFGENLSTDGIDVTGAIIGERWRVGGALLEVSRPRIPCTVFAGFWGVPDLVKRFTEHGAPGAYLRVIEAGELGAGDAVEVVHRPAHGLTIGATFRALTTRPDLLPLLLTAPELPARLRAKAERRAARRGSRAG
jgi:MOSC domain-containing protein YiiM